MIAESCPICSEPYKAMCRCPISDKVCKNGHHWHRCPVHRKIVVGEADHTLDTMVCRCPPDESRIVDCPIRP